MIALEDPIVASTASANTVMIDIRKTMQLVELIVTARPNKEIILMDGETPLARIVLTEEGKQPRRFGGLFQGEIRVGDDFDDPLPDEFWMGDDAPSA